MPRIAGTDIPDNKPIRIALRYVFGVGPKIAEDLLQEVGIEGHVRANTLTEEQCAQISNVIEAKFLVEGALRRQISQNIGRLRDIRCYRGDRHRRGLPVRGQRTQTNARTRKGRKKTVAGKKGVKGQK
ncbi:MAG: 30S ribosomal protein S13 [Phycisphaeraceae bacterium]|nr:30S ribosomal protein S13 [Phycisphaeraceae bacterium]